jgi:hypothetical protein
MIDQSQNGSGQNGSQIVEAPSSASLWGDVFGIGNLIKTITDPSLGQHAHSMMQAIIESGQASRRIEQKLDALLQVLGHGDNERSTALLAANRTDGGGRPTLAGRPVDDGTGSAAPSASPRD